MPDLPHQLLALAEQISIHSCAANREAAVLLLRKAAAVIERLPVTEDGVTITPGMRIYLFDPGDPENVASYAVAAIELEHLGDYWISVGIEGGLEPRDCYSTEQAARAAGVRHGSE
jgi:hypothetical protein